MTTTVPTMIQRHTELHRVMDGLYEAHGDTAVSQSAYRAASREAMALEPLIIATPATTQADSEAKRAFVEMLLEEGAIDLRTLIATILKLDGETVAEAA